VGKEYNPKQPPKDDNVDALIAKSWVSNAVNFTIEPKKSRIISVALQFSSKPGISKSNMMQLEEAKGAIFAFESNNRDLNKKIDYMAIVLNRDEVFSHDYVLIRHRLTKSWKLQQLQKKRLSTLNNLLKSHLRLLI
jgi:hypothetical protein